MLQTWHGGWREEGLYCAACSTHKRLTKEAFAFRSFLGCLVLVSKSPPAQCSIIDASTKNHVALLKAWPGIARTTTAQIQDKATHPRAKETRVASPIQAPI